MSKLSIQAFEVTNLKATHCKLYQTSVVTEKCKVALFPIYNPDENRTFEIFSSLQEGLVLNICQFEATTTVCICKASH